MAVATTPCLQWSQPSVRHSPTAREQPFNDAVLLPRSSFLGTMSSKLCRTRSFELTPNQRPPHPIRRASSASFDNSSSSDDDFSRKIQEFALRFQLSDENLTESETDLSSENRLEFSNSTQWIEMMKAKKNQWQEGFVEAGESAYCSIQKAFSSMVFIIQELHSFTLQMREALFYEDLQGILARVQREIHASFVWLFQQVFSHTPTLMVYIMILLANFTVHSMSNTTVIAAPPPLAAAVEQRESSTNKSFSVISSPSTKTTSVGESGGGGSKTRPVASGMDGDGWKSIVEEASRMQGQVRDEGLERETLQRLVSPVTAKMEGDEYEDYFKTELVYQTGLAQEPNNVLLLANYAQFLYLVVHDFDRAEEYFKRAVKVEPKDAEAHNKYANFLWQVRNDLWAAEETFLEAISADPTNSYYAASYAHFLWNTGGEDTCFPLTSLDNETLDV